MIYIGIDPGASAGFAVISAPDKVVAISCKENMQQVFQVLTDLKGQEVIIGLEKVHAIFGCAASSTFGLGAAYGGWVLLLTYLGFPYVSVPVRDWQKAVTNAPSKPKTKGFPAQQKKLASKIHKDSLKLESLQAAQAAFPNVVIDNHDVADAINIARYVRLQDDLKKK